ncbi:mucolipin-3-like [Ornithodoros turicata]
MSANIQTSHRSVCRPACAHLEDERNIDLLDHATTSRSTEDSYSDHGNGDTDHLPKNPAYEDIPTQERMRRKLRFFFMNPIEKYQAKGRVPWKLTIQVTKIVLVTAQLVLFGTDSYSYQQQHRDTTIALHHIFLSGWDSVREVAAYPPAAGPYAVYTKREFYDHVNQVVKMYSNITTSAIGSFGYDSPQGSLVPMRICKKFYRTGYVWPFNDTLIFDNHAVRKCLPIDGFPANDPRWKNFRIDQYLGEHNFSIIFQRLIEVKLKFTLKTVFLKSLSKYDMPDCYSYNVSIVYNNKAHDGQLLISLEMVSTKLACHTNVLSSTSNRFEYGCRQAVNAIVILNCISSLLLCTRSLMRGQKLRKKTVLFFETVLHKKLTWSDKLEFVDFWYVMIIVNDVLIVVGSCFKIQLEQQIIDGQQYNLCSTLLGMGNLLVWAGVLRYLGFFKKYNILILTMRRALPNILRFLLCAVLLYAGFCFCGWVVLGPHHIKFRSLSMTSECLFALMNGDDMFATFAILDPDSVIIWWFSRFYLYLFLILFIYCVISLFLSVIMDSYETIREIHEHGMPPGDLQTFISECSDHASSGAFRNDDKRKKQRTFGDYFFFFRRVRSGYTAI